jgi:hypothetical protein
VAEQQLASKEGFGSMELLHAKLFITGDGHIS